METKQYIVFYKETPTDKLLHRRFYIAGSAKAAVAMFVQHMPKAVWTEIHEVVPVLTNPYTGVT